MIKIKNWFQYSLFVMLICIPSNLLSASDEISADIKPDPHLTEKIISLVEAQNELLKTQIHGSRAFYLWSMYWMLMMCVGLWQYEGYINYRTSK